MTPRQREVYDLKQKVGTREAARQLGIGERKVREIAERAKKHLAVEEAGDGVVEAIASIGVAPEGARHGWRVIPREDGGRDSVFWKVDTPEPADTFLEAARDAFARFEGRADITPAPSVSDDDLAVIYPRPDFHLGMLAWGRETGTDWDLNLAIDQLGSSAASLVQSAPPAHTGVVLGLGDAFHADDERQRTPESGHNLDVDGRYPKIVEAGVWLEVAKIKLALERHQHVVYKVLAGNHDPHSAHILTIGVKMYFTGHPRVTVDDSPAPRWYWRWGRCLIGATHGHTVKQPELPLVMAAERPQDWAETTCRRFYTGHMHHKRVIEHGGVLCEQFGSPAPRDAYHAAGPWISGRGMTAIFLHRERGEIGRCEFSLS